MAVSRHSPCVLRQLNIANESRTFGWTADAKILKGAQNPGYRCDTTQHRCALRKNVGICGLYARATDRVMSCCYWVRLPDAWQNYATIPVAPARLKHGEAEWWRALGGNGERGDTTGTSVWPKSVDIWVGSDEAAV
jgi:hypothetical protein